MNWTLQVFLICFSFFGFMVGTILPFSPNMSLAEKNSIVGLNNDQVVVPLLTTIMSL